MKLLKLLLTVIVKHPVVVMTIILMMMMMMMMSTSPLSTPAMTKGLLAMWKHRLPFSPPITWAVLFCIFFHLSPYHFGYFSTFFENSEQNCQKLKLLINARFLCWRPWNTELSQKNLRHKLSTGEEKRHNSDSDLQKRWPTIGKNIAVSQTPRTGTR